jgi:shikimate kinase
VSHASRSGHLILVGLPGSGKSSVGEALARRLGLEFLDFDREIERREGMPVARIFSVRGERWFRDRERELTAELRSAPGMVLAPGGGWVTNPEVVALLRPPGRIIYLEVDPATALRRLSADLDSRPLLRGPDPLARLVALLADREPRYRAADHVVRTQDVDIEEVAGIVAKLASTPGHR